MGLYIKLICQIRKYLRNLSKASNLANIKLESTNIDSSNTSFYITAACKHITKLNI